jgi:CheY-like chemotaxis protein
MNQDASARGPVAAVINTSPDTVDLLKDALERAGFIVVTSYTHDIRDGTLDVEAFLRVHRPHVIVYDIAPPYDRNWEFLQHLRTSVMSGFRFVLTTTNPGRIEALANRDEKVYEVVGKADDLEAIVRATKEAARARDTR